MKPEEFRSILRRHPRAVSETRVLRTVAASLAFWPAMVFARHLPMPLALPLVSALFACFSFRSFALMHECVHAAASKRVWLNNLTGFFCGIFCFLPFAGWRDMHVDHHLWTGNIDKDPTTKILLAFEKAGYRTPRLWNFAWTSRIPLLGLMQHVVFWKATVSRREYLFLAGSILYLSGAAFVLGPYALLAGLFAYLVLVECVNLPHHLGMEQYHGDMRFPFQEQNRFTRSCVYPRWFAHHVLLNFNLHTAHHLYPAHPWYQLDAIHAELVGQGLQLNLSENTQWTALNRNRPLNDVLRESFASPAAAEQSRKRAA